MLKKIKMEYTRANVVILFLSLCFGTFLISLLLFLMNFLFAQNVEFLSMQDAIENTLFESIASLCIFFVIVILIFVEMQYIIPKYSNQIIIFSKGIPKHIILIADIVLSLLPFVIVVASSFNLLEDYDMSTLSPLLTIISGSIISPIVKGIKDIPTIKVEILNNRIPYNKDSNMELDKNDYISVRVLNPNNDPQVIKFRGICIGKDIDHIVNENDTQKVRLLLDTNENKLHIIPVIETVAPHSVSKIYHEISLSKIIDKVFEQNKAPEIVEMLTKKEIKEKKIHAAAVYENEDGNLFIKTFVIKNISQL